MVVKSPDMTIDNDGHITNKPNAPTNDSSSPSNSHNNRSLQNAMHYKNQSTKSTSDNKNSIAQHVDSSITIDKNSLRLDLDSLNESMKQDLQESSSPKCDNKKRSVKRNFSMISFKSLDFNLKSICSSMKGKHGKESHSIAGSSKASTTPILQTMSSNKTSVTTTTKPPYLKVETVDQDAEEEHLLISFPQSPYSHRGSFDKTQSQHLTATHSDYSRSQTNSPFLSINTSQNIRRSSTSDIIDKKPVAPSSGATPTGSRRPSTSDLLRRARERKGSETKGGRFYCSGISSNSIIH